MLFFSFFLLVLLMFLFLCVFFNWICVPILVSFSASIRCCCWCCNIFFNIFVILHIAIWVVFFLVSVCSIDVIRTLLSSLLHLWSDSVDPVMSYFFCIFVVFVIVLVVGQYHFSFVWSWWCCLFSKFVFSLIWLIVDQLSAVVAHVSLFLFSISVCVCVMCVSFFLAQAFNHSIQSKIPWKYPTHTLTHPLTSYRWVRD